MIQSNQDCFLLVCRCVYRHHCIYFLFHLLCHSLYVKPAVSDLLCSITNGSYRTVVSPHKRCAWWQVLLSLCSVCTLCWSSSGHVDAVFTTMGAWLFCFSEADLYEIFARHSIETGREVREGFYAHRQTANQNALESQAASHLSGLASASSQLVQNTSASQQSQHTSANRHSHTTSTTNQQSSSDALSPSLEARSQTVATTIQQLIATSATNTSSHLGHQQTEAKSQLYGENVTVSKAEDACRSRVRHISSDYETRIALMGRGRPPAVTNTHSEQAQNVNASEVTSRNVQSRGRHLSAGYQARIALMGDDRPFAAVANTHDKEQADLYNRLGRETGSRAAHNRSGSARQRSATNESGVEVVRMTASKQAENWHGRQELGAAGEKPPWYEESRKEL